MSSANNMVFGNDINVLDATQVYPLGTERLVLASQSNTGSDQVWRYVYNSTANPFAVGQVVMAKASTLSAGTGDLAAQDTPKDGVLGVAQTYNSTLGTFTAGTYGWVLAHGYGTVLSAAAGVAANVTFGVSATAGSVYASPASVAGALGVIGYNHVAIVGAVTGTAWIDCR